MKGCWMFTNGSLRFDLKRTSDRVGSEINANYLKFFLAHAFRVVALNINDPNHKGIPGY